ncbi:MAG TPA: quinone oxidoreductase [Micromonosporaceae bacterium]|jgi:NADPH2:quinone reductase|nr:quinone oxidoreductase [Micromonosporaceae bacterium]
MRAVRIHQTGGTDVMVVENVSEPQPGPGEVLVRLTAVGVNFIDTYHRSGLYPMPLPLTLGSEGAGEVVAVGDGVDAISVGQRVGSTNFAGAYAEFAIAAASRVVPLPADVDDDLAAGALLQGMTAHYLLHDTYPVRPGDTVLVHAAAGGMGLLLCQLARRMGVRVIGTASTSEKADLAQQAGAAEVLDYDDVAKKVRALTDGEGVAAVYDGVGAATFDASLASLRPRGVLATFGNASGPVPPVDPLRLTGAGSVYLSRPTLAHFIASPDDLARRAGDVLGWVADGTLSIRIGGRYPLADAARAHEDLAGRRTTGKLLLVP